MFYKTAFNHFFLILVSSKRIGIKRIYSRIHYKVVVLQILQIIDFVAHNLLINKSLIQKNMYHLKLNNTEKLLHKSEK